MFIVGIDVAKRSHEVCILMQTEVLFFSPCGARPL